MLTCPRTGLEKAMMASAKRRVTPFIIMQCFLDLLFPQMWNKEAELLNNTTEKGRKMKCME